MHNKNGIYVKSQGWAQNRLTYVETLSQIGTNLSIWSISEPSDLRLWLKVGNFMELLQALSNDIEWFLKSLLWMIQSTEQCLADTNSETNQNHSQKKILKNQRNSSKAWQSMAERHEKAKQYTGIGWWQKIFSRSRSIKSANARTDPQNSDEPIDCAEKVYWSTSSKIMCS